MAFKQVKVLKFWQFFGNFLILRKNYRPNSQVMFNRETRFWEIFCLSGHNLFFAEKSYGFWKVF